MNASFRNFIDWSFGFYLVGPDLATCKNHEPPTSCDASEHPVPNLWTNRRDLDRCQGEKERSQQALPGRIEQRHATGKRIRNCLQGKCCGSHSRTCIPPSLEDKRNE